MFNHKPLFPLKVHETLSSETQESGFILSKNLSMVGLRIQPGRDYFLCHYSFRDLWSEQGPTLYRSGRPRRTGL